MAISSFDDLLRLALEQAQPQRLLLVFAAAGLPDDASDEQRARFEAGEGGTLTPQLCVDKAPGELASFQALVAESRRLGQPWDIVFVAALAGTGASAPTPAQADAALKGMVESIKSGRIGGFVAFDARGEAVRLA